MGGHELVKLHSQKHDENNSSCFPCKFISNTSQEKPEERDEKLSKGNKETTSAFQPESLLHPIFVSREEKL